jgi:transposase InsO family protein
VSSCSGRAIENTKPKTKGLRHLSNRGCPYSNDWFQNITQALKVITCSMSRTGCCYDNAVAECFFWSLNMNGPGSRNLQSSKLAKSVTSNTSERFAIQNEFIKLNNNFHLLSSKNRIMQH